MSSENAPPDRCSIPLRTRVHRLNLRARRVECEGPTGKDNPTEKHVSRFRRARVATRPSPAGNGAETGSTLHPQAPKAKAIQEAVMKNVSAPKMLRLVCKTLDLVDPRLIRHGLRVAALVHKALLAQGKYGPGQMRDICIVAALHDIGAYKTEELNKMLGFETTDVWNHSLQGYLYLKYFSPLGHLAPVVCYHHGDYNRFRPLRGDALDIAQIINIADRIDVATKLAAPESGEAADYFANNRGVKYDPSLLALFDDDSFHWNDDEIETFPGLSDDMIFDRSEVEMYLQTVLLSIDFRSAQTVTHTVAAVAASTAVARLMGLDQEAVDDIYCGAMLHDLGKQGIPLSILESPDRLGPEDMEIMKTHTLVTERLLAGNLDETVVRIAALHHEKMNGSGYPYGLRGEELTVSERLVAIADIFSALHGSRSYKEPYPKEKIVAILADMAAGGLLDADIVATVVNNVEYLMGYVHQAAREVVDSYVSFKREHAELEWKVRILEEENNPFPLVEHVGLDVFGESGGTRRFAATRPRMRRRKVV